MFTFLVQARAEFDLKFLLLLIFSFRLVGGAEENWVIMILLACQL